MPTKHFNSNDGWISSEFEATKLYQNKLERFSSTKLYSLA